MNAIDYFYPKGMWDGCAKFYEPCIPGRVMDKFIPAIQYALKTGDNAKAIHMLNTSFYKNVHDKKTGALTGTVECFPTETAMKAIELLREHSAMLEAKRVQR